MKYEPKDSYLDWNPSNKFLAKAKRIYRLHENEHLTIAQIATLLEHHRSYVGHIFAWYKRTHGKGKQK